MLHCVQSDDIPMPINDPCVVDMQTIYYFSDCLARVHVNNVNTMTLNVSVLKYTNEDNIY